MASLVVRFARRGSGSDVEPVLRGARAAQHRGSDAATATLGSTSVAITNGDGPSSASIDADDGLLAALAGRLDEADELAKELRDAGQTVDVANHASIVRAMFRRDGDAALARLRGVFEGVVTDGRTAWT